MTKREDYLNQIHRILAVAELELASLSRQGMHNGNIVWEDIANRILNICFSYGTDNLNRGKANFPGIDLGNRESGLGVQVTRRKETGKIEETINAILKHKVYESFPKLKIFILGRKNKQYHLDGDCWNQKLRFDTSTDILDFDDIKKCCQSMETEKLQELVEYLEMELDVSKSESAGKTGDEKADSYMRQMIYENSSILIIGLGKQLSIEKAWIRLQLLKKDEIKDLRAEQQSGGRILEAYHEYPRNRRDTLDVETLLVSRRNKVILAGPGMGKSTLCKKLLFLVEKEGERAIKVQLMDLAAYMRNGQPFDEALRSAMTQSLNFRLGPEEIEGRFRYVFLDGLDECGDMRRRAARDIRAWAAGHPAVNIIVTSRPIGYDFSYLSDFEHYEIQPLSEDDLDNYVRQLLAELKPESADTYIKWFQTQMSSWKIKKLACRSPLLLGFLLQLSIRKESFGQSPCDLYEQILIEWMRGSSRENKKELSDAELQRGIEAAAFYLLDHVDEMYCGAYTKTKIIESVGVVFSEELGCSRLAGTQKAEICVDFWTERGILDRSFFQEEERYLFLHLNIGEYLAGRYISNMSNQQKQEWVRAHYRQNIWHETICSAIACERGFFITECLIKIEQDNRLPEGCIFLAAQGIGERKSGEIPQALYDKLMEYIESDNPFLSEKSAIAACHLREKNFDWHAEKLVSMFGSKYPWAAESSYHIYLQIPSELQKQDILENYIKEYAKKPDNRFGSVIYENMEETVKKLQRDRKKTEVIEAVKSLYWEHCSVKGMGILHQYLVEVGEEEWADAYVKEKNKQFNNLDILRVSQSIQKSERMLIHVLADLFGTTEPAQPLDSCRELSKLYSVIGLMKQPIGELRVLQKDLKRDFTRSILKAACIAGDIQIDKLRCELYVLINKEASSHTFISHGLLKNVQTDCKWEKTKGLVNAIDIMEGLCSNSNILGLPAKYIAYANSDNEEVKKGIIELLFSREKVKCLERIALLISYIFEESALGIMIERLNQEELPCDRYLYDSLTECSGTWDWEQWLNAVNRGLCWDDASVVVAAVEYLQTFLNSRAAMEIPQNVENSIWQMVKRQFHSWLNKKVICPNCGSGAMLNAGGFCPECHIGQTLPLGNFMELMVSHNQWEYKELIKYMGHENDALAKAARAGLKKALFDNASLLKECLEKLKDATLPDYVFKVILELPAEQLSANADCIWEVADGCRKHTSLTLLKVLDEQDWIPGEQKKAYIEKMLEYPDDNIKSIAMACWMGDKSFQSPWIWR